MAAESRKSDAMMNEHEVAAFMGLSVRTLQDWRVRGGGPRFVKFSKAVRYRRQDIDAWVEARMRAHTSEYAS